MDHELGVSIYLCAYGPLLRVVVVPIRDLARFMAPLESDDSWTIGLFNAGIGVR